MKRLVAKAESQPKVVCAGTHTAVALLVVSFCLAAGIPVTAGDGARTAQQAEDWKALEQRWDDLIEQRGHSDITKWNSLEADFRAFAKKYDLHLEEHAKKAKPGPSGGLADAAFVGCPPRDDVRGYRCYLFPGPKGVCRYVRVPIGKK